MALAATQTEITRTALTTLRLIAPTHVVNAGHFGVRGFRHLRHKSAELHGSHPAVTSARETPRDILKIRLADNPPRVADTRWDMLRRCCTESTWQRGPPHNG